MTAYLVYDVFTDAAFGGNPLAVIPDASALPEAFLLPIAREFGFSETSFVYPPDARELTARVRIFTPTQELPFAGHPTIGTAIALRDQGHAGPQVLGLGIGPIPVETGPEGASFTTTTPLEVLHYPAPEHVAACLALPPDTVRTAVMASVGLPFVLVELAERTALDAARPMPGRFRDCAKLYPAPFDFALYAYVPEGETIHARMFAPLDGIAEDPATGSAAAALGAFLAREGRSIDVTIHQGDAMGRPSRIGVSAREGTVRISGNAVRVMSGDLHLPL